MFGTMNTEQPRKRARINVMQLSLDDIKEVVSRLYDQLDFADTMLDEFRKERANRKSVHYLEDVVRGKERIIDSQKERIANQASSIRGYQDQFETKDRQIKSLKYNLDCMTKRLEGTIRANGDLLAKYQEAKRCMYSNQGINQATEQSCAPEPRPQSYKDYLGSPETEAKRIEIHRDALIRLAKMVKVPELTPQEVISIIQQVN